MSVVRRAGGDEVPELTRLLLSQILHNDALTRGLGDAEARILVEWLVEEAEELASGAGCQKAAQQRIDRLCRRGRAISRFVALWSERSSRGAAGQLAVAEGFNWPLPSPDADLCEVMQAILTWESEQAKTGRRDDQDPAIAC
jgi:hypothetical protein